MKVKLKKQGECGAFCFKYWLGKGCDEDCNNYYIRVNYAPSRCNHTRLSSKI